jgi:hypothetical protein
MDGLDAGGIVRMSDGGNFRPQMPSIVRTSASSDGDGKNAEAAWLW